MSKLPTVRPETCQAVQERVDAEGDFFGLKALQRISEDNPLLYELIVESLRDTDKKFGPRVSDAAGLTALLVYEALAEQSETDSSQRQIGF